MCSPATCDLPGCSEAEICQSTSEKRQFECPDGIDCGPGPVCTVATCGLPGCADAEVCNDLNKRTPTAHPNCDICIVTSNGKPACGCAIDSPPDLTKRCPQYCIETDDGELVCGCAAVDYEKSYPPSPPKREARVCPLFCIETDDGETLCGCAAEDYEKSQHGGS